MPLAKKHIETLRQSFPDEAIQSVKKYRNPDTGEDIELLGFKPPYVIERLNDVFGHEGWNFEIIDKGIAEDNKSVWVYGRLTAYICHWIKDESHPEYPLRKIIMAIKEQFGVCGMNKFLPLGDAFKGASTNCLEKAASLFDIGHEAYKGKLTKPKVALTPDQELDEAFIALKEMCQNHSIDSTAFIALTKNVLSKEVEAKEARKKLNIEEVNKLIDHIAKTGSPF